MSEYGPAIFCARQIETEITCDVPWVGEAHEGRIMKSRAWGIGVSLVVVLLIVLTNYWGGGSPTSAGVLQGLSAEQGRPVCGERGVRGRDGMTPPGPRCGPHPHWGQNSLLGIITYSRT